MPMSKTYNASETAELVGVQRPTILRWIASGKLVAERSDRDGDRGGRRPWLIRHKALVEATRRTGYEIPESGSTTSRNGREAYGHAAETAAHSNSLLYVDGRFNYNGQQMQRPQDTERVRADVELLVRFMDNYAEFGEDADRMQRDYFAAMAWLYYGPFMPRLRHALEERGPGNFGCKHVAVLYGESNCGKSTLIKLLMASMFDAAPAERGDKDFEPRRVDPLMTTAGVCPLYFDDIRGTRFGRDAQGTVIVKQYDRMYSQLSQYPSLVVSMNSDAIDFPIEVRKRCLMIHADTPLPLDDVGLGERMDAEAKDILSRMDNGFYREYLHRMEERFAAQEPNGYEGFDYLAESSRLIRSMFGEYLPDSASLPYWCGTIGSRDFDERRWDETRSLVSGYLAADTYVRDYPPPIGYWTKRGEDFVIGVDAMQREGVIASFPATLVNRTASVGARVCLRVRGTEAFIRRSWRDWDAPVSKRRRGILSTLFGSMVLRTTERACPVLRLDSHIGLLLRSGYISVVK